MIPIAVRRPDGIFFALSTTLSEKSSGGCFCIGFPS